MKIRHGFVSNSSSSSFVLVYRDISQIEKDQLIYGGQIPKISKYEKLYIDPNRWLSDAGDIIFVNEEIAKLLIETDDKVKHDWDVYVGSQEYYDFPLEVDESMVGKKLLFMELDYHNTKDEELFSERYVY